MKSIFTKKRSPLSKLFGIGYLITIFTGFGTKALAQYPASSYGFTALSSTYTELGASATGIPAVQVDDALSASLPIGFTFTYCGIAYQNFKVSSNGWLTFNTALTGSVTGNATGNFADVAPALWPLWDDLNGNGGTALYEVSGAAPNRVLTVELRNWRWNWLSTPASISFQIKLYETTNVIEYVYRQEAGAGSPSGSGGATIGILDDQTPRTYLNINNSSTAPVPSSTTFTTAISVKPANGQLYRFSPPQNCSLITSFPTAGTTTASPTTICLSGNVNLTAATATAIPPAIGLSYAWERSVNGGTTWTADGTSTINTYSTTVPVTVNNTIFRYRLVCNGTTTILTSAASAPITINNPGSTNVTGAERCGPGTLTLSASPVNPGNGVNWYENATGGLALANGSTFTTPSISATTTYYAAASSSTTAPIPPTWVGTGTTSNTNPNPYFTTWWGTKNQFLIRASEMTAAGLSAGTITSISFQTTGSFSLNLTNYTVGMKSTTLAAMPAAYETGFTTVYSTASYTPVLGLNTHTLTTPFVWDGSSNIIIETCFNNNTWSGGFSAVGQTYPYNATYYGYGDISTVCSGTPTYNYNSTFRPNIRFEISAGCEGPRVPVDAIIRPFPEVDLGNDLDTCVDVGLAFTVDAAPQPNNPTYLWDNGATTSTRLIDQSGTYHVTVTNEFGCVGHDTLSISIKDNPVVDFERNGLNLCEGGSKILDAGPDGENGGSYYWDDGTQSRYRTINSPGQYIVYVTSPEGCLQVDTANIVVSGQMPTVDGISAIAQSPTEFTFGALNPQHVVEYIWIIGNDTINMGADPVMSPPYAFPSNGNYMVYLMTNSTCGQALDSLPVTIVGLGLSNVNNNLNVKVYPNPSKGENITLETEGDVQITEVSIFNIIGQQVYADKNLKSSANKYQLTIGDHLSPGIYNVRMRTNRGLVNRKIEILK